VAREQQPLLAEGPHRPVHRAGPAQGGEEQADRLLDLLVRAEDDPPILGIDEAHR
jgi:hypothetical protein